MFKWLYTIGLALVSLIWLPKLLQKKYRARLPALFGKGLSLKSSQPMRIWVHAVSLGETKAIIPLVKKLKEKWPDAFIVLSSLTATGLEEAKKEFAEADRHITLPFDLVVRKFVREMKPTLVILSEADFWYNFLDEAKRNGAKIVLVNGKISSRSMPLYRYFPPLLKSIDSFIVQAELYQKRFLEIGVDPAKIHVSGNLKFDAAMETMPVAVTSYPILVVGSTHEPEEKIFLNALSFVWKKHPSLQVYLVPRHPERFDKVAKIIEEAHIPFTRYSEGTFSRLTLVDEMGRLKQLYRQADICVVAGSWTPKVGGHNVLEPAFFGKPVIFGPYMHNQPEFCDLVLAANAGLQIPAEELPTALIRLLDHPEEAHQLGANGLALIQKNHGSVDKTLALIQALC